MEMHNTKESSAINLKPHAAAFQFYELGAPVNGDAFFVYNYSPKLKLGANVLQASLNVDC